MVSRWPTGRGHGMFCMHADGVTALAPIIEPGCRDGLAASIRPAFQTRIKTSSDFQPPTCPPARACSDGSEGNRRTFGASYAVDMWASGPGPCSSCRHLGDEAVVNPMQEPSSLPPCNASQAWRHGLCQYRQKSSSLSVLLGFTYNGCLARDRWCN